MSQDGISGITWEEYFMGMAEYVSKKSKDPSTKVGAVIVRPDWTNRGNTVVSMGYNGFPRRMIDRVTYLKDRAEKYPRVIHAEMNAILMATEPLDGCTLYVWPLACCAECAKHVCQAGIDTVIYPHDDANDRWEESHAMAAQLFRECNVTVRAI